jgi:hypothetical protein
VCGRGVEEALAYPLHSLYFLIKTLLSVCYAQYLV